MSKEQPHAIQKVNGSETKVKKFRGNEKGNLQI